VLGRVSQSGSTLSIASNEPRHLLTERVNALPLAALGVSGFTVRSATLNDVFLHLTSAGEGETLVRAA
jgi:hypothetical protein